eukprot:6186851-Pleurochrysis_carterae.AAC.1
MASVLRKRVWGGRGAAGTATYRRGERGLRRAAEPARVCRARAARRPDQIVWDARSESPAISAGASHFIRS